MEKIVAHCGLVCTECKAYVATKENDDAKRTEVAEAWSKGLTTAIKPEEINCDGCLSDGRLFTYCNTCEIRKCGIERGVVNCAYCPDYGCEKLVKFFEQAPEAKKTLEDIRQKLHK